MLSGSETSAQFNWALFIAWGLIVSITASHHEFWRDEVRALSFSMQASTPSDLVSALENEGHPLLWYVLLYGTYHVIGSTWVLPAVSLLIAAVAVYIFIFFSPFPEWMKTIFVLSGLPVYEYSVMARNYGISMLLLFMFATLYPLRKTHPLSVGCTLALLCNTNVHSMILVGLLMNLWLWDLFVAEKISPVGPEAYRLYQATMIVGAGAAAALYAVWPTDNMIASDRSGYTAAHIGEAFVSAIEAPAKQFGELFPSGVPIKLRMVVLVAPILGLLVRPPVAMIACAAFLLLSVFFEVVYTGWYRHQGLFVVFLVSLYWIVINGMATRFSETFWGRRLHRWRYSGIAGLLACTMASGAENVYRDWTYQKSASKTFAEDFLKARPEYKEAILMGEPDFIFEAVPYYTDHLMYIARESRFGHVVRFVRNVQLNMSLGELLCIAWRIQVAEQRPVLLLLGHRFLGTDLLEPGTSASSIKYIYERTFTWSKEDLTVWKEYTHFQRKFDDQVIGDEAYTVYSLISPEGRLSPCH